MCYKKNVHADAENKIFWKKGFNANKNKSYLLYSAPELMLPVFQHFICLFLIYLYIEKVKFFPDDWQTLQLSVHYLHVTAAGN